ncbi:MAG: hypothetical protein NC218_12220 [Acetobacter sp.]|nr:hypothetical protein [Acetobacter sp.]
MSTEVLDRKKIIRDYLLAISGAAKLIDEKNKSCSEEQKALINEFLDAVAEAAVKKFEDVGDEKFKKISDSAVVGVGVADKNWATPISEAIDEVAATGEKVIEMPAWAGEGLIRLTKGSASVVILNDHKDSKKHELHISTDEEQLALGDDYILSTTHDEEGNIKSGSALYHANTTHFAADIKARTVTMMGTKYTIYCIKKAASDNYDVYIVDDNGKAVLTKGAVEKNKPAKDLANIVGSDEKAALYLLDALDKNQEGGLTIETLFKMETPHFKSQAVVKAWQKKIADKVEKYLNEEKDAGKQKDYIEKVMGDLKKKISDEQKEIKKQEELDRQEAEANRKKKAPVKVDGSEPPKKKGLKAWWAERANHRKVKKLTKVTWNYVEPEEEKKKTPVAPETPKKEGEGEGEA